MTTYELLALSLGLSVVIAAMAWGAVRLFERATADPILRERAWTAALYIPVLPVLMVAVLLTTPRPVVEALAPTEAVATVQIMAGEMASAPTINAEQVALAVLALAMLIGLARGVGLAVRTIRLHRLIDSARPADADVIETVRAISARTGTDLPTVRMCRSSGEAMVTGFIRPTLILPDSLTADPTALRNVCAHELTHLKRGDHRALWIEEALLTVLAINPVLRLIRDRRAAAREEACDAQVLAQADGDTRRLYARSLLDALRVPAGGDVPALTFTSTRRIFVMHRLKAILSPAPIAGLRPRLALLGMGVALAAVAGASSVAVAGQREPEVISRAAVAPVVRAQSTPRIIPTDARVQPAAKPVEVVVSTPKAEPAPRVATAQQPEVITNPSWSRMPMPLSYPAAAIEQGLTGGQANLSCTVERDGRVSGCTVISETPEGAGFGAAGLEAAAEARLSPRSVDGVAVGGTVRFSIRFTMSAE